MTPVLDANPGLTRVLSAADVPFNGFGIYPDIKDQPVLADGLARYRGEAIVALVGERDAIEAIEESDLPIEYQPLTPVTGLEAAMAAALAPISSTPNPRRSRQARTPTISKRALPPSPKNANPSSRGVS